MPWRFETHDPVLRWQPLKRKLLSGFTITVVCNGFSSLWARLFDWFISWLEVIPIGKFGLLILSKTALLVGILLG